MTTIKKLYELQQVDSKIANKEEELASVRARLKNNQALLFARSKVQKAQSSLKELQTTQRELELEIESIKSKVGSLEKKLYGGSVKNSRELSGLQEEIKHLVSRQQEKEDRLLEIMESVEETQGLLGEAKENLQKTETRVRKETAELVETEKQLQGALSTLESERNAVTSTIDQRALSTYERLRKTKHGLAVVRLEHDTCQGCRIALPTKMVQMAKASDSIVQCNSCGRILYVN